MLSLPASTAVKLTFTVQLLPLIAKVPVNVPYTFLLCGKVHGESLGPPFMYGNVINKELRGMDSIVISGPFETDKASCGKPNTSRLSSVISGPPTGQE